MVNQMNVSNPSTSRNPVKDLWTIDVLYGTHPDYPRRVYAVRFTSLIGDRDSTTALESTCRTDKNKMQDILNLSGVMESRVFSQVMKYITYLKSKDEIERVDSLLPYLNPDEGEMEAQKLYEQLVDAIFSDLDMFPTVLSGLYERGVSDGVILDTETYITKYELRDGAGAVAVTTGYVQDILGLGETRGVRYREITRAWLKHGLLLNRDKAHLQDAIYPWPDRNDTRRKQRLYVFHVDDMQNRLDRAAVDVE